MASLSEKTQISLQNHLVQDKISIEELEALVEREKEEMRRKEILAKHTSPIVQLPSGRWYTRIHGKKKERVNLEDLENLIIEEYRQQELKTLQSIYPDFLERRKMEVAPTTWSKDIRYFNTFISASPIAQKQLKDLTLSDGYRFLDFCLGKKEDLKRKYWNNIMGTLNMIIQFAIDEGYITRNPFINMRPRKDLFTAKTQTRDGDTVFTKVEQEKVCRLAEEDSLLTGKAEPLGIILLFNLGLRSGELCALKWSDIETNIHGNYIIHVQREQVVHMNDNGKNDGYEMLDHTKTPAGDRRLRCNSKVVETLSKVKSLNETNGISTGLNDFIFVRKKNDQILNCTSRSFDPRLRKYCRKAAMPVIKSCHDIRRTVLTKLYEAGMPLKKIQEYAGHSTLKQTMDYIRISDDDLDVYNYLESLSDTSLLTNVVEFKREA